VLIEYDRDHLQPPCLMAYDVRALPDLVGNAGARLGREMLLFEGANEPPPQVSAPPPPCAPPGAAAERHLLLPDGWQRITVIVSPVTFDRMLNSTEAMAATPPVSVLAYAMPYTVRATTTDRTKLTPPPKRRRSRIKAARSRIAASFPER
jgi:hypothetical protein